MCLAIPGKVVSIDKNKATIDFSGFKQKVGCGLVKFRRGDFVRVQQGFIVERISKKEIKKFKKIFNFH